MEAWLFTYLSFVVHAILCSAYVKYFLIFDAFCFLVAENEHKNNKKRLREVVFHWIGYLSSSQLTLIESELRAVTDFQEGFSQASLFPFCFPTLAGMFCGFLKYWAFHASPWMRCPGQTCPGQAQLYLTVLNLASLRHSSRSACFVYSHSPPQRVSLRMLFLSRARDQHHGLLWWKERLVRNNRLDN